MKAALADSWHEYSSTDSGQRLQIVHKPTGTRLRALSSSGKRAMGLSQFGLIIADEPGSWETRGGELMWDALRTSPGKLADQRVVLIGTRSPAAPGTWWPELRDTGCAPGRHVEARSAPDDAEWDSWATIAAVNPLIRRNPSLRKTILRERDEARKSTVYEHAFRAYRLNQMVGHHSGMLLPLLDWKRVLQRDPPEREGQPVLGLDLGGERAWSAAWAMWPNGRSEIFAMIPGFPDIETREKRDSVPSGTYRRLVDAGVLLVDEGMHRARPSVLVDHLTELGIKPSRAVCDRFLINTLRDDVAGRWRLSPRRTR